MVGQNKQGGKAISPQDNVQRDSTKPVVPARSQDQQSVQVQTQSSVQSAPQVVPQVVPQPVQAQSPSQEQVPASTNIAPSGTIPKQPLPTGKKRILIAEDEKAITSVLQIKLGSNGFMVDIANNGKEAIELLKTKQYDVVLLDLIMPIVNGFEVLEFVNRSGIKVPIIVTSNLSQKEDIEKAKSLGAKQYFVKSEMTLTNIVDLLNKLKNGT